MIEAQRFRLSRISPELFETCRRVFVPDYLTRMQQ
jgi:hypothetical protein